MANITFTKFKYDNDVKEVKTTLRLKESSDIWLVKLRDIPLTIDDFCELSILNSDMFEVLNRDLSKNLDTDTPFPTGTYFQYQLSTTEVQNLAEGRFHIYLRIYNDITGYSTIVYEEELLIKS